MNNYQQISKIQKSLKELNCLAPSAPPYTLGQVQNTFKCLYFGLNFLNDLAKESWNLFNHFPLVGQLTAT